MIASGGCTAAFLACLPGVERIHLVDPNPAQLALLYLKQRLLLTAAPAERKEILGHAPLDADSRRRRLSELLRVLGLPTDCLGRLDLVAALGPDHAGRYELLFARLRQALATVASDLEALLRLTDPREQARRVEPGSCLGDALNAAYDDVLALPNLVRLFGEGATQNPVEPFSRHFARRTRAVLATMPAATNPYLWSMLAGHFPDGVPIPWLDLSCPSRLPEMVHSQAMMADVLAGEKAAHDFVHLSNILDWLTPAEATRTLELAWQALRPGGRVFIRQLNSTLDIPALGPMFRWDHESGGELLQRDRSFFYRALHLGWKA
jgi:S-adenosylmethionine-diacylglycerol 3-amino-3-carboxypropyl transferase